VLDIHALFHYKCDSKGGGIVLLIFFHFSNSLWRRYTGPEPGVKQFCFSVFIMVLWATCRALTDRNGSLLLNCSRINGDSRVNFSPLSACDSLDSRRWPWRIRAYKRSFRFYINADNKPIMKSVNASVFYSNCYVGPQQIICIYPNTKYIDVYDKRKKKKKKRE
jgi:hypothetical protein